MAGGLAGALRQKHPAAFGDYLRLCEKYNSRNAGSVADFFRLPGNAVVELGTRVQI